MVLGPMFYMFVTEITGKYLSRDIFILQNFFQHIFKKVAPADQ